MSIAIADVLLFVPTRIPSLNDQIQRHVQQQISLLTAAAFLLIKGKTTGINFGSQMTNKNEGKDTHLFWTDGRKMTYTEYPN